MDHISKNNIDFLIALGQNNTREWFTANKNKYTAAHEEMIAFAENLMEGLSENDQIVPMSGKKSLFRIYRDVRFSNDKSPYKSYWAGSIKRDTPYLRGGYYYRIEPEKAYIASGFWNPNAADLKLIRDHIALDPVPLREIISTKSFKNTFGELEGDQVKTAPKGFSKDDPAIDLLRYKQMIVTKPYTVKEMTSPGFTDLMIEDFQQIRPFLDYMSDILTHDLNGIPLY
jgi:uncharacterized protein (TIGR02453 family)